MDPVAPPAPPPVGPSPWEPVPTPTPPQPTPVPTPPPATTVGSIDQATYDALAVGMTEAQVVERAGSPFRVTEAAHYRILTYTVGADAVATIFVKDGKVERKSRFP